MTVWFKAIETLSYTCSFLYKLSKYFNGLFEIKVFTKIWTTISWKKSHILENNLFILILYIWWFSLVSIFIEFSFSE